jgi:hypothetical protein
VRLNVEQIEGLTPEAQTPDLGREMERFSAAVIEAADVMVTRGESPASNGELGESLGRFLSLLRNCGVPKPVAVGIVERLALGAGGSRALDTESLTEFVRARANDIYATP